MRCIGRGRLTRHRFLRRSAARRGVVLTTMAVLVLPVLVLVGLLLQQWILLGAAQWRVLHAARLGTRVAVRGGSMQQIHDQAGLVLGYLGGDYRTQREFFDVWDESANAAGSDGLITQGDQVAVGVTIPMALVSTNYMGMLGVNVNDLRLREVILKEMDTDGDLDCP